MNNFVADFNYAMSNQATIDHIGWVDSISGQSATIKINSQSACASCHAKGACSAADQEEKTLVLPTEGRPFLVGEQVRVHIARKLGLKAVAVGYLYPFLLLMIVLISLTSFGLPELQAGLFALLSLFPYYLVIFLLKDRLNRNFTFKLEKI